MKLPVVKYSPVGAVFDTWSLSTHHAFVTTFAFQATLKNTISSHHTHLLSVHHVPKYINFLKQKTCIKLA